MPDRRAARLIVAILRAAVAGSMAASCGGERIVSQAGHGVIRLPATSIQAGHMMTAEAGVLYDDGRFVPFEDVEYRSSNPAAATVGASTGVVNAVSAGTTLLTAIVPQLTSLDTTITVLP